MLKKICKYCVFFLLVINILVLTVKYELIEKLMVLFNFRDQIYEVNTNKTEALKTNDYYKELTNKFVSLTDNFIPENYEDLKNIYFTILNSGDEEFTFYCHKDYENCTNDLNTLTNDTHTLSFINNFINTFNSYNNITTSYNNYGRINVKITKTYSKEEIEKISNKIDEIINSLIKEKYSDREKVRLIHDYIINNTNYDDSFQHENNSNIYLSDTAYGPLFQGYGICSGYTDLMAIFLDKMNIPNYKISNDKHIWNYVYIDNSWLHLDLTWDDPVNESPILRHDYFLITTENLEKINNEDQKFNKDLFLQ